MASVFIAAIDSLEDIQPAIRGRLHCRHVAEKRVMVYNMRAARRKSNEARQLDI
jgi:hypothetical protein